MKNVFLFLSCIYPKNKPRMRYQFFSYTMSSSVAARINEAKWIRDRNVHFPILRISKNAEKGAPNSE
jgi:hypothetical protein